MWVGLRKDGLPRVCRDAECNNVTFWDDGDKFEFDSTFMNRISYDDNTVHNLISHDKSNLCARNTLECVLARQKIVTNGPY